MPEVPISVLILTLDEEVNLPGCLESLGWCDDVVVLDSHSSDATREIAAARGARVVERAFDDYASQRSFGLNRVAYRHPWVLMVDADERVPPDLAEEMRAAVAAAGPEVALFRMRRRDHLMGTWIRRSGGYPTWFGRLARVGRVRVERPINEEYLTDGATRDLAGHLDHYPFNKGIAWWVERHNRYSSMEAVILADRELPPPTLRGFLHRDPVVRRRALKAVAYRLPGRPIGVFLGLYLWRLGLLDGRAGLVFCLLRAYYELLIDLKVLEVRRRRAGLCL